VAGEALAVEAADEASAAVVEADVRVAAVAKVAAVAVVATTIKVTRVSPESRAGRLLRGERTKKQDALRPDAQNTTAACQL
jgi:hypothetical protein